MAEEKTGDGRRRRAASEEEATREYSDLPPGTHSGLGGNFGTITIPESGSYKTSDPVEIDFIEGVLGGTAK